MSPTIASITEDRRQNTQYVTKTPQLIEHLLDDLRELYQLSLEIDDPSFSRAQRIVVPDEGMAKPSSGHRAGSWTPPRTNPSGRQSAPRKTKRIICWHGGCVNLAHPAKMIAVYIDVTNGNIYGGSITRSWYDKTGDWTQYLDYTDILALIADVKRNIGHAKATIREQYKEDANPKAKRRRA